MPLPVPLQANVDGQVMVKDKAVVNVTLNGKPESLAEGCTLAELLSRLDVNPKRVAVEVNEILIPRAQHAEYTLRPGDRLEVVTLVGGG